MPSIEENLNSWNKSESFQDGGEEWSQPWGGSDMQWWVTLYPRLHLYLPTEKVLEIGPGYGRWTDFLKNYCQNLIVIDISQKCIDRCKERFANYPIITYYVNEGKSLDMITDRSIDLAFSFDSLVHAEEDVLEVYINQLARKLKKDGVAFIHHSNLGEHVIFCSILKKALSLKGTIFKIPVLLVINLLKKIYPHRWRAMSMSAKKCEIFIEKAGMKTISQEIITWGTFPFLDCISVFTPNDSLWAQRSEVFRNKNFMKIEVKNAFNLSRLYGKKSASTIEENDPTSSQI